MTAQEVLARMAGEACWRAERGHGTFLTFDFGQRVHGPHRDRGTWHLWVYAGDWRLRGPDGVLATDQDELPVIDRAIARFEGARLARVTLNSASLDTTFDFEQGVRLDITSNSDAETRDADWWLLFTPDERVLVVGPGPAWSYRPSSER